jgi:hypothetical protein
MPTDASEIFLRNGESVLLLEDSTVVEYEVSEFLKDMPDRDMTVSHAHPLSFDAGWRGTSTFVLAESGVA